MVVTATDCLGTIGGGRLELQCVSVAAQLLAQNKQALLRKFVLGASQDQGCGGVVEVLFEPVTNGVPRWLEELRKVAVHMQNAVIATSLSESKPHKAVIHSLDTQPGAGLSDIVLQTAQEMIDNGGTAQIVEDVFLELVAPPDLNIAVFGAGHVGSAVVDILAGLDADIRWIDNRKDIFTSVPGRVRTVWSTSPSLEVNGMPPSSFYLVMTHSHKLDLEICMAILARNDAAYCGLVGSSSKRRSFEKQLRGSGLSQALIDTMVCPIGVDGIATGRFASSTTR